MAEEKTGLNKFIDLLTGESKVEADIEVNTKIDSESLTFIMVGILSVGVVLILFSIMLRKLFSI